MRDIKFRAWDKDNRQWVYSEPMPDIGFWKWVKYDSTTVFNESTGLTDKNGVEIYEGDIVSYESIKGQFGIHQIVYKDKAAAFLLQAITSASRNPIGMKYLGDIARSNRQYDTRTYELCEVIGNIHENPELLKEKE